MLLFSTSLWTFTNVFLHVINYSSDAKVVCDFIPLNTHQFTHTQILLLSKLSNRFLKYELCF